MVMVKFAMILTSVSTVSRVVNFPTVPIWLEVTSASASMAMIGQRSQKKLTLVKILMNAVRIGAFIQKPKKF